MSHFFFDEIINLTFIKFIVFIELICVCQLEFIIHFNSSLDLDSPIKCLHQLVKSFSKQKVHNSDEYTNFLLFFFLEKINYR